MRYKAPLLVGIITTLAACATVYPDPRTVRVFKSPSQVPKHCIEQGELAGSGTIGRFWHGYEMAQTDLQQNAAYRFHADTIAITGTEIGADAILMQGIAYKCRADETATPSDTQSDD